MIESDLVRRRLSWLKQDRENAASILHLIKVEGWRFEPGAGTGRLRDVTDDRRQELERQMAQIKGLEQDEYSWIAAQYDDDELLAAYEQTAGSQSETEANMLLAEIRRRELSLITGETDIRDGA